MNYHEEELFFEITEVREKGIFDQDTIASEPEPELNGIKVRIGNSPIVYNLEELMRRSNRELSPELQLQFESNNIYLVTHAIGVVRISGKAKVVELQYDAEVVNVADARTIDLLPKTRFNERFKVELGLSGTVKAAGSFSAEVPEELKNSLSGTSLSLGGELELELSTNAKFVGKVNYSIKLPVVQSSGVASNKCTWILNPDANPLLGDQLLVQTITVPKGINNLTYSVKGLVKVDKGLFYKTETKETTTQNINVKLT